MAAIPLKNQDINVIHSLDFKSYHHPFDIMGDKGELLTWGKFAKKGAALSVVAHVDDKRVGFAVWDRARGYIVRLGVLPDFRRNGIGRSILGWVCDDLRTHGKTELRVVLSQDTCLGPNDPDDVSGFMKKVGFKWIDTVHEAYHHYNKYEDGLVFQRKLV